MLWFLAVFVYFYNRLGVFKEFKGVWATRGCFAFLVVRSSSSDSIGLFKFVVGIVPDCSEGFRLFSRLSICFTLCLVV